MHKISNLHDFAIEYNENDVPVPFIENLLGDIIETDRILECQVESILSLYSLAAIFTPRTGADVAARAPYINVDVLPQLLRQGFDKTIHTALQGCARQS